MLNVDYLAHALHRLRSTTSQLSGPYIVVFSTTPAAMYADLNEIDPLIDLLRIVTPGFTQRFSRSCVAHMSTDRAGDLVRCSVSRPDHSKGLCMDGVLTFCWLQNRHTQRTSASQKSQQKLGRVGHREQCF